MTPRGKTANSTTIMVERRKVVSQEGNVHVGGGQHSGIIINKETRPGGCAEDGALGDGRSGVGT